MVPRFVTWQENQMLFHHKEMSLCRTTEGVMIFPSAGSPTEVSSGPESIDSRISVHSVAISRNPEFGDCTMQTRISNGETKLRSAISRQFFGKKSLMIHITGVLN